MTLKWSESMKIVLAKPECEILSWFQNLRTTDYTSQKVTTSETKTQVQPCRECYFVTNRFLNCEIYLIATDDKYFCRYTFHQSDDVCKVSLLSNVALTCVSLHMHPRCGGKDMKMSASYPVVFSNAVADLHRDAVARQTFWPVDGCWIDIFYNHRVWNCWLLSVLDF